MPKPKQIEQQPPDEATLDALNQDASEATTQELFDALALEVDEFSSPFLNELAARYSRLVQDILALRGELNNVLAQSAQAEPLRANSAKPGPAQAITTQDIAPEPNQRPIGELFYGKAEPAEPVEPGPSNPASVPKVSAEESIATVFDTVPGQVEEINLGEDEPAQPARYTPPSNTPDDIRPIRIVREAVPGTSGQTWQNRGVQYTIEEGRR